MFDPIDFEAFEARTGLHVRDVADWSRAIGVVSLRSIVRVLRIELMTDAYLEKLLHSVTLEGDSLVRPYAGCRVRRMRMDPEMVSVGQTFVEERKLLNLQANFHDAFRGSGAPGGFAKKVAMILLGETGDGRMAVSHYLPPIIERHGETHALLDGVHRCYTAMRTGTTIEVIKISGITTAFPCGFGRWRDVQLVAAKPPREQRYHGLKPELFRDLKYIGIDG